MGRTVDALARTRVAHLCHVRVAGRTGCKDNLSRLGTLLQTATTLVSELAVRLFGMDTSLPGGRASDRIGAAADPGGRHADARGNGADSSRTCAASAVN